MHGLYLEVEWTTHVLYSIVGGKQLSTLARPLTSCYRESSRTLLTLDSQETLVPPPKGSQVLFLLSSDLTFELPSGRDAGCY